MSPMKTTRTATGRLLALVIAVAALSGLSITAGAALAAPPTGAESCKNWATVFREDGSMFSSRGECTSYVARGGTLRTSTPTPTPPPPDPTPNVVTVTSPGLVMEFQASGAEFGPALTTAGVAGPLVLVNDGIDAVGDACTPLVGFPAGAIALVDRGVCTFVEQVLNAAAAGAVAVVVANNVPGEPVTLDGSGQVGIPSVMVSQPDGATIKSVLPANGVVAADG